MATKGRGESGDGSIFIVGKARKYPPPSHTPSRLQATHASAFPPPEEVCLIISHLPRTSKRTVPLSIRPPTPRTPKSPVPLSIRPPNPSPIPLPLIPLPHPSPPALPLPEEVHLVSTPRVPTGRETPAQGRSNAKALGSHGHIPPRPNGAREPEAHPASPRRGLSLYSHPNGIRGHLKAPCPIVHPPTNPSPIPLPPIPLPHPPPHSPAPLRTCQRQPPICG